jgi:two-component SAPR family response regulator
MNDKPLSGRRIIIVEDDYYQAFDSKQMLEDAGAEIVEITAVAPDLAALLAQGPIDAGLIDINLGQNLSLDFARALRDQAIPFVFLTGYDKNVLPEDLADMPCLSKPADQARIVTTLKDVAERKTG